MEKDHTLQIFDTLISIMEYRNAESGQHILRIRKFTGIILEEVIRCCPEYGLTDREAAIICNAAALHDIGKIAIPDAVLTKPGPLTKQEQALMQTHVSAGCRILDSLAVGMEWEYMHYARQICRCHHERWDGGGYPEGLAGEQIPVSAQVVGLADVVDALTSRRSYREALPFREAAQMILRGECGAFSPKLLECFRRVMSQLEEQAEAYAEGLSPREEEFPAPPAESEAELREKLRRYEIILAQTENVLFEWDLAENRVSFSDTWEKIFGYPPPEGPEIFRMWENGSFHPEDVPLLVDRINALAGGSPYETAEIRMATARGRWLWCRCRASAVRDGDGKLQKVYGIFINIDAEKKAEQRLQDRAERDQLTKLLNKQAGRKQAEEYFLRYPDGVDAALLIIDLDNFKQVNDRYGHLFGDSVLTQAAREIRRLFRNQDIVARIGGDEFMVVMRGVSDRQMLQQRCSRMVEAFRDVFQDHRYKLPLSCSIGVALAPESGKTYYDLFRNADIALYQAKALGKNRFVIYSGQEQMMPSGMPTAVNNTIDSDREPGLADDNIVRYAFHKLYSAEDMGAAIHEILSYIGRKMNVSRVYVFENSDDNRFCSNTYEWCNEGIRPEIGNLQSVSYETDIPGYADNFNEEGIFYCPDISVLPDRARAILEAQDIQSMLQCAIRENGVFRGYIGFDECVEQRFWTMDQIRMLIHFSEALSMFLLRARRQQKVQQQADGLRTILDNQNAWIYIIDPDTCRLKYINARTRKLAPGVQTGMTCHKAVMGRDARCPGCPALHIREKGNNCSRMRSEKFPLDVWAEATLIRWEGEESCLLTCREMDFSMERNCNASGNTPVIE